MFQTENRCEMFYLYLLLQWKQLPKKPRQSIVCLWWFCYGSKINSIEFGIEVQTILQAVLDLSLCWLNSSYLLASDWGCVGSAKRAISLYNFHLLKTDRNLSLSKELKSIWPHLWLLKLYYHSHTGFPEGSHGLIIYYGVNCRGCKGFSVIL